MSFGYSRLLVPPLSVHAEISLRPRHLLCFASGLAIFSPPFSPPLAIMYSRLTPRVNSLLFMSITPNVIRVFSFTGSTSQRGTLRFPCAPAICLVLADFSVTPPSVRSVLISRWSNDSFFPLAVLLRAE